MERWPGWSAPLLGALGGALGGLGLAGDPKVPFDPWQAVLVGAVFGLIGGLIVWAFDKARQRPVPLANEAKPELDPVSPPDEKWKPKRIIVTYSRKLALEYLMFGLACLGVNDTLAVFAGSKFFPLVLGGSFFAAIGVAGLVLPQLIGGGKVPWWGHVLAGVLTLGGLAFGFFLWLVAYR